MWLTGEEHTRQRKQQVQKGPEMEIFWTYCVNSKVASIAEQSRAEQAGWRAVGGDVLERVCESK